MAEKLKLLEGLKKLVWQVQKVASIAVCASASATCS
jgi:hypothetical protein